MGRLRSGFAPARGKLLQMMSAFIPKRPVEPESGTIPRTKQGVHVRVFHATS
jgi:hypothetical protein